MGWVASYPFLSQAPTPVEVELGCDKKDLKEKCRESERSIDQCLELWTSGECDAKWVITDTVEPKAVKAEQIWKEAEKDIFIEI